MQSAATTRSLCCRGSRRVERGSLVTAADGRLEPSAGCDIAHGACLYRGDQSSRHRAPGHSTFGLSSSCERDELMLALVTRVTPVSTLADTCSPFEAASAIFTPS